MKKYGNLTKNIYAYVEKKGKLHMKKAKIYLLLTTTLSLSATQAVLAEEVSAQEDILISGGLTPYKYEEVDGESSDKKIKLNTCKVNFTRDLPYTAGELMPEVTVTTKDGVLLTEGEDYQIIYKKDGNIIKCPTEVGSYTILIKAKAGSNYEGNVQKTFKINQANLNDNDYTFTVGKNGIYDGKTQTPEQISLCRGKTELQSSADYTISYMDAKGNFVEQPKDAGVYWVMVTGVGNYSGSLSTKWEIAPMELTAMATVQPRTYEKENQTAELDRVSFQKESGEEVVLQPSDYNASVYTYADVNVGQKKKIAVAITLKNKNYTFANGSSITTIQTEGEIRKAALSARQAVQITVQADAKGAKTDAAIFYSALGMPTDAGDLQVTVTPDSNSTATLSALEADDGKQEIWCCIAGGKGDMATLTAHIVSQNYEDTTVPIHILLTQQTLPHLTAAGYSGTYTGKAITMADLGLQAKVSDVQDSAAVAGRWELYKDAVLVTKMPTDVADSGTYIAKFIPQDGTYAEHTICVDINITAAKLNGGVIFDTVDTEKTFAALSHTGDFLGVDGAPQTGAFTWKKNGNLMQNTDTVAQNVQYTWTFLPDNPNYQAKECAAPFVLWAAAPIPTITLDSVTIYAGKQTVMKGYQAFSVTATPTMQNQGTPDDAKMVYEWYLNGKKENGATGATYTFAAGKAAGEYTLQCKASYDGTTPVASNELLIAVRDAGNSLTGSAGGASTGSNTGAGSGSSANQNSASRESSEGNSSSSVKDFTENETDNTEMTVSETDEMQIDGAETETILAADGSSATLTTAADGKTKAVANISEAAIAAAQAEKQPVSVPVTLTAGKTSAEASTLTLSLPAAEAVVVEIPVKEVTNSTVVVWVHEDGTEEIIKTTAITENGLAIKASGDVQVKILENKKEFSDVTGHWAEPAVTFLAARNIISGVEENVFGKNVPMTRGMVYTVLARLDGVDTAGGVNWYDKGAAWAVENSISDGTNPEGNITRQQLAAILYRFAGSPAVQGTLSFADAEDVDSYAEDALLWATQKGIMSGMGDGTLAPQANADRAQVAVMLAQYVRQIL